MIEGNVIVPDGTSCTLSFLIRSAIDDSDLCPYQWTYTETL